MTDFEVNVGISVSGTIPISDTGMPIFENENTILVAVHELMADMKRDEK